MRKINTLNSKYAVTSIILLLFVNLLVFVPVSAKEPFYNSINDCQTKDYPGYNLKCFAYFASQGKDIHICLNQNNVENCFYYYAAWEGNSNICNSIGEFIKSENSKVQNARYSENIEYYQDRCFDEVALASRNDNICSASNKVICKENIQKLNSYYLYITILLSLFFATLIFLFFFFRKDTKIRLFIATLISLVPPVLIIPIKGFTRFIKDFDFFFEFNKSAYYLNLIEKNISDMSFIFVFAVLIFLYLPTITLIRAYQAYKLKNTGWWQFLIIFFAMHVLGIVLITFATIGYSLGIALVLSGASALVALITFFIFVIISKKS